MNVKKDFHYSTVIFDLDGTLTEPSRGLIAGFRYALGKMGIDYGPVASLTRFIGPPLIEEWQREFRLSPEEAARAVSLFREYFSVYGWWDNEVYRGIPELLASLRAAGCRLATATSKPEEHTLKILRLFNLEQYFDFVGAADSDHVREHKWEVLAYTLEHLGVHTGEERAKCVLIGDRKYDAEGAAMCGIDAIGVRWGHGSEAELTAAPFRTLVSTPEQLCDLLLH